MPWTPVRELAHLINRTANESGTLDEFFWTLKQRIEEQFPDAHAPVDKKLAAVLWQRFLETGICVASDSMQAKFDRQDRDIPVRDRCLSRRETRSKGKRVPRPW